MVEGQAGPARRRVSDVSQAAAIEGLRFEVGRMAARQKMKGLKRVVDNGRFQAEEAPSLKRCKVTQEGVMVDRYLSRVEKMLLTVVFVVLVLVLVLVMQRTQVAIMDHGLDGVVGFRVGANVSLLSLRWYEPTTTDYDSRYAR